MTMRSVLSTALASMLAAHVAAQSSKDMGKPTKNDTMTSVTYTGCVQGANHGGTLVLLTDGRDSGMASMHHEQMKDDAAMKNAPMHHDEAMDTMKTQAIVLTGSDELKTHIGQRVSVTGPLSKGKNGAPGYLSTIAVKTLNVLATSCPAETQP